ncbi:MAG: hypothetical protein ACR2OJ_13015 [Hyphomicrobiales bacterium]
MKNLSPIGITAIAAIFLVGCQTSQKPSVSQSKQPVLQQQSSAFEQAKIAHCKPNNGLAEGVRGDRGSYRSSASAYSEGNKLGRKLYKLKERRRKFAEKIRNFEFNLDIKKRNFREAPKDSERYVKLRGEISRESWQLEREKFKLQLLDDKVNNTQREVDAFRARHA